MALTDASMGFVLIDIDALGEDWSGVGDVVVSLVDKKGLTYHLEDCLGGPIQERQVELRREEGGCGSVALVLVSEPGASGDGLIADAAWALRESVPSCVDQRTTLSVVSSARRDTIDMCMDDWVSFVHVSLPEAEPIYRFSVSAKR